MYYTTMSNVTTDNQAIIKNVGAFDVPAILSVVHVCLLSVH